MKTTRHLGHSWRDCTVYCHTAWGNWAIMLVKSFSLYSVKDAIQLEARGGPDVGWHEDDDAIEIHEGRSREK